MSEAKIVIHRDPPNPNAVGKLTQAAANAKAVQEQVRNRRDAIHQQAKLDAAGTGLGSAPEESVPAPEREDIDSIEITLRDGRVVEYGPPGNISLSDRIARLYSARSLADGGPDPGLTEYRLTRLLMGVRAINGNPVHPVTNLVERTRLANQLGDQAIDLLNLFDNRHWPPLTEAELPVVKKNLRQPGL
jgi:hypothetical protein